MRHRSGATRDCRSGNSWKAAGTCVPILRRDSACARLKAGGDRLAGAGCVEEEGMTTGLERKAAEEGNSQHDLMTLR